MHAKIGSCYASGVYATNRLRLESILWISEQSPRQPSRTNLGIRSVPSMQTEGEVSTLDRAHLTRLNTR